MGRAASGAREWSPAPRALPHFLLASPPCRGSSEDCTLLSSTPLTLPGERAWLVRRQQELPQESPWGSRQQRHGSASPPRCPLTCPVALAEGNEARWNVRDVPSARTNVAPASDRCHSGAGSGGSLAASIPRGAGSSRCCKTATSEQRAFKQQARSNHRLSLRV